MIRDQQSGQAGVRALSRSDDATATFSKSASAALPGPRGRTGSVGGLQLAGVLNASAPEAVYGCPSPLAGQPKSSIATHFQMQSKKESNS